MFDYKQRPWSRQLSDNEYDIAVGRKPAYKRRVYSGICVCGCKFEDHHLCMVMNADYRDATGEAYIAQECERYGFNETGGLGPDGKDHCQHYRDKDDPENSTPGE